MSEVIELDETKKVVASESEGVELDETEKVGEPEYEESEKDSRDSTNLTQEETDNSNEINVTVIIEIYTSIFLIILIMNTL